MAGVLEIPAVVGLGKFITDVSGGDTVIVDGTRGVLILNPDDETLERYERSRRSFRSFETQLEKLRDLPAETRDGVRVPLLGNIEFPKRPIAWNAAPMASVYTAPSFSTLAGTPTLPRRSISKLT